MSKVKRSNKEFEALVATAEGRLILSNEEIADLEAQLERAKYFRDLGKATVMKEKQAENPKTESELYEAVKVLLVEHFITSGNYDINTVEHFEDVLFYTLSQDLLNDAEMTVRGAITNEIGAQLNDGVASDDYEMEEKVVKKLAKFDFTPYQDMTIEELRSCLWAWDESKGGNVRGENLIRSKYDRACVGVYALTKGGTYIYN